ncbi:unnamed protein product [Prunus armeniaca]
MEKLCLALYFTATKLRHYMLPSVVHMIAKTDLIKYMLTCPIIRGRTGKWTMALVEFTFRYVPQQAVKGQALADFLAAHPCVEIEEKDFLEVGTLSLFPWHLYFDGSRTSNMSGAGVIIELPKGFRTRYSFQLDFDCTNNQAEYVALIIGLEILKELGVKSVAVMGDSMLVLKLLSGDYKVTSQALLGYHALASQLMEDFDDVRLTHLPREHNTQANAMAQLASGVFLKPRFFFSFAKVSNSHFQTAISPPSGHQIECHNLKTLRLDSKRINQKIEPKLSPKTGSFEPIIFSDSPCKFRPSPAATAQVFKRQKALFKGFNGGINRRPLMCLIRRYGYWPTFWSFPIAGKLLNAPTGGGGASAGCQGWVFVLEFSPRRPEHDGMLGFQFGYRLVRTVGSNPNSLMSYLVLPGMFRVRRIVNRSPGYSEIANPKLPDQNFEVVGPQGPELTFWDFRAFSIPRHFSTIPNVRKAFVGIGNVSKLVHALLGAGGHGTRAHTDPQEGPSRGPASSDQG